MTRTLIGLDYEGIPSLKITKGDLDPVTTLDSTLGAFLFNSKDTVQTKVDKIEIVDSSTGTAPPGANLNNFSRWRYAGYSDYTFCYQKSHFPGLEFDVPLIDFLPKDMSTGYYLSGNSWLNKYGYGDRTEYNRMVYPAQYFVGEPGWKINANISPSRDGNLYHYDHVALMTHVMTDDGWYDSFGGIFSDLVVWNLPGDETPLPAALPSNSGQKSITINAQGLRIAKPGYDVDTATESQLSVSSTKRPIKIVAADDIAVPAGNSEYTLETAVPLGSICDIQFYTGEEIVYPGLPRSARIGASWRINGNKIQFINANGPCRARFIVIASDEVSQTTGDNQVMRQITVNGENVVQFLKPGSSDNPSFSDIIIDSRWPALRILKQGYFSVGQGALVTTIPIDTTGYYPFVKFSVVCGGQSGNYERSVRPPTVAMYRVINQYGGDIGWNESGHTTYARVNSGSVSFYTFAGRPKYYYWLNQTNYRNVVPTYKWPDPVLGIRYYIFGIPKKDTP